ncbi:hypothetical protein BDE02_04G119200 [Populus trichocarpa]|nr:hypothetical protein BDE02_04G119200 [Populus trichocarpa]KAI5591956.1 hypothetical protein BDE02_04G119200 [Populus trichocarpa]
MALQDPVQRSRPIVTYVRSPISGFNGSTGSSATSMAYSNLLTEGPIKAIVFSQWTSMLDLVEISLNQYCIQCRRLDGITMTLSSRDRAVKDFNTDPEVTLMLMSLKGRKPWFEHGCCMPCHPSGSLVESNH